MANEETLESDLDEWLAIKYDQPRCSERLQGKTAPYNRDNRAYMYENRILKPTIETCNGRENQSAMEQLPGQMTRLLEQTQVQQQQLQKQQRQAEERTAQLIEHLGERRANYDKDGGERRPYRDQPRRLRAEALKEGEDIEKFLLIHVRSNTKCFEP